MFYGIILFFFVYIKYSIKSHLPSICLVITLITAIQHQGFAKRKSNLQADLTWLFVTEKP